MIQPSGEDTGSQHIDRLKTAYMATRRKEVERLVTAATAELEDKENEVKRTPQHRMPSPKLSSKENELKRTPHQGKSSPKLSSKDKENELKRTPHLRMVSPKVAPDASVTIAGTDSMIEGRNSVQNGLAPVVLSSQACMRSATSSAGGPTHILPESTNFGSWQTTLSSQRCALDVPMEEQRCAQRGASTGAYSRVVDFQASSDNLSRRLDHGHSPHRTQSRESSLPLRDAYPDASQAQAPYSSYSRYASRSPATFQCRNVTAGLSTNVRGAVADMASYEESGNNDSSLRRSAVPPLPWSPMASEKLTPERHMSNSVRPPLLDVGGRLNQQLNTSNLSVREKKPAPQIEKGAANAAVTCLKPWRADCIHDVEKELPDPTSPRGRSLGRSPTRFGSTSMSLRQFVRVASKSPDRHAK